MFVFSVHSFALLVSCAASVHLLLCPPAPWKSKDNAMGHVFINLQHLHLPYGYFYFFHGGVLRW